MLTPPVTVALAQRIHSYPTASALSAEPKLDGWRCVAFRRQDAVDLQARSGRLITGALPDITGALMQLPPGVVLDGEVVVYSPTEHRFDFLAVQRRALSAPRRAAALARQHPASYAVFDLLQDEAGADLRARPYTERRAALLELLAGSGPPVQPVPATTDRGEALEWFEAQRAVGIEGLVLKPVTSPYVGGRRRWLKLKHDQPRPTG